MSTHKWKIKHIRPDFHSATWVMPQGWDLGVPWGVEGVKKFFPKFQPELVCKLHGWHMQQHIFMGLHPLRPWGGAKSSNIIKSHLLSQFRRFLNQTLCVFSQIERYKRYFHSIFSRLPGSCPRGGIWGGGQFFFWNSSRVGVWVTYMNDTCNSTILGPSPLGHWAGAKGQISLNLSYLVNFKYF